MALVYLVVPSTRAIYFPKKDTSDPEASFRGGARGLLTSIQRLGAGQGRAAHAGGQATRQRLAG